MLTILKNPIEGSALVASIQKALGVVLSGSNLSESGRVAVYSYSRDFSVLWEINGDQSFRSFLEDDFLIVVDDGRNRRSDLPEASIHLTAYDWAVWFSLSRDQKKLPKLILITDDATKGSSGNDAERFWQMFPNKKVPALPWINIVSLVGKAGEPCCLVQLLELILGGKGQPQCGDLAMIRQIWQSFFLRPSLPSANHNLANVLGVGVLTGDFGDSPTRQALSKLLTTLELLPMAENWQQCGCPKAISEAGNQLHTSLPKEARTKLRLFLVDDDQERYSWGNFLAGFLELRKSAKGEDGWVGPIGRMQSYLSATDSADDLLQMIRASRSEKTGLPFDVLFLDLRLFERASLAVEAKFFLDLVQELRTSNHCEANPGDWPQVCDGDLHRLENWCNLAIEGCRSATRNDDEYIDSLTLLPRLVAILNIDLPIVIFSSTQRRRVSEILRRYGNIITTFSKPTIQLGNSQQLVDDAFQNLERATLAAMDLVRARRTRLFLINSDFTPNWEVKLDKPNEDKKDHPWSVQLLIDESEKTMKKKRAGEEKQRKLTVGGFLAIYPPGVSPDAVNDVIYQQLPDFRKQGKESRRKTLSSDLWKVIEITGYQPFDVLVIPIALGGIRTEKTTEHSAWNNSSLFYDEMVEDNLHREIMRSLVELALFVIARQMLPDSAPVEFYFHAPTRSLPVTPSDAVLLDRVWGVRSLNGLAKHFDHNCARPSILAKHFDHNCARPLVDELFREYRGSTFNPQPVRARAYGLNTNKQTEVAQVHMLHYLADGWVSGKKGNDLQGLKELEIKGNYGPAINRLLQAHRHLLRGEIGLAIAIGTQVASQIHGTERTQAVRSIVLALQNAALSMTGSECLDLARALRQIGHDKANQSVVGKVRSVSDKDGSAEIEWGGKVFRGSKAELNEPVSVGDEVQFVPRRGNRVGTFIAKNVQAPIPLGDSPDGKSI